MRPWFLHVSRLSALVIMVLFPHAVAAQEVDSSRADEEIVAPGEAVFDEIELSVDGVIAVDSNGEAWEYNFERDLFVPGDAAFGGEGATAEGDDLELENQPVELRATEERHVKRIEGTILVGYDEYVDGSIFSTGRVTIKGWVKGDVRATQERVLVTATGRVDGDVIAPEIVVRPGGQVLGQLIEEPGFDPTVFTEQFSENGLWVALSFAVFFIIVALLIAAFLPKQLDAVAVCIAGHPSRSYFLGLAIAILMPAIVALLVLTIVGIVLIPFLPFITLFSISLGVVAAGRGIGARFYERFFGRAQSDLVNSLTGVTALMLLWVLVALLLGSPDTTSQGFGVALLVLAIVVSSFPLLSGIGASALTRLGLRRYLSWRERHLAAGGPAPAPAPPPIPSIPRSSVDSPSRPGTAETPPDYPRTSD